MNAHEQRVNRELGRRLRNARKSRSFTLDEVARISDGDFKVSILGAYERGERAVSVARLVRLADLYSVTADMLLRGIGCADDAARRDAAVQATREMRPGIGWDDGAALHADPASAQDRFGSVMPVNAVL